jgi:hypothetical protein
MLEGKYSRIKGEEAKTEHEEECMPRKHKYIRENPGVVIWEEYVGRASNVICYPGVSSCITITCVSPAGLNGAHITMYTDDYLIENMINSLATMFSAAGSRILVIGNISMFKANTRDTGFDTRKKIAATLRESFNYRGGWIYFHDTAIHAAGVHIGVVRNRLNVINIGWKDERTATVRRFEVPDVTRYTQIPHYAYTRR